MTIRELLSEFRSKNVLVIGDVMIDAYMLGKVHRVSPEAPVPIVSLSLEDKRLGGAANVALNLQALGANPILCAVVGEDQKGTELVSILDEQRISSLGILKSPNRVTTVKTRVIGNNQHLLRIDAEDTHALSGQEENDFLKLVTQILDGNTIDAIIFEDYNKGVLTENVNSSINAESKKRNIPTTVDPKKDNFWSYKGVTLFKPNLKELSEGVGYSCAFLNRVAFDKGIAEMQNNLGNQISFVTLSEHGVFIKDADRHIHVPAHIRTIADVSGAGDTVIAVATLCLASGMGIQTIAELSNLAGGLVCEKSGVVTIEPDQLIRECEGKNFD